MAQDEVAGVAGAILCRDFMLNAMTGFAVCVKRLLLLLCGEGFGGRSGGGSKEVHRVAMLVQVRF